MSAKNRRLLGALAAALCLAAVPRAHAIVSYNEAARTQLLPGDFNGGLDGLARLSLYYQQPPSPFGNNSGGLSFVGVCSGSLLEDGRHVLTAAHCAEGFSSTTVDFMQGAVSRTVVKTTLYPGYVLPSYGHLFDGSDLAILELDSPVTEVKGFALATQGLQGETVLVAGYGRIGNGFDGSRNQPDSQNPVAHYGYNQYDVSMDGILGDSYLFDFDSDYAGHDTACIAYGACGTALGLDEVMIDLGDSGGGSYFWDGGQWLLSGVHSVAFTYATMPCPGNPNKTCWNTDAPQGFSGVFGTLGGDISVASHLDWIKSFLVGANEVPEPGTWALCLLGLAGVAATRRRNPR